MNASNYISSPGVVLFIYLDSKNLSYPISGPDIDVHLAQTHEQTFQKPLLTCGRVMC